MNLSDLHTDPATALQSLGYVITNRLEPNMVMELDLPLYHWPEFLHLKDVRGLVTYFLVSDGHKIVACWHWTMQGNEAYSLPGVPFGGPVFAKIELEANALFIKACLHQVLKKNLEKVTVLLPAKGVIPEADFVQQVLGDSGFQVSATAVNHHLITHSDFLNNLHPSAKRRYKKCASINPVFSVEPIWELVYNFILSCRQQKGWQLSLTKADFTALVAAFPGRYFFFALRHQNKLIAATIGVLVTSKLLYNYAPAHHADFDAFSPQIYLLQKQTEWCREKGIQILDLGTSMLGQEINQPLATFKTRVGGVASEKVTLTLHPETNKK